MAGIKQRGPISVQHKRTHNRDGEDIEVKPVTFSTLKDLNCSLLRSNARMIASFGCLFLSSGLDFNLGNNSS